MADSGWLFKNYYFEICSMKLIHKILSLGFVLSLVALASCEEQRILFEGPEFVRFTDTTLTYKESLGRTGFGFGTRGG